MSILLLPFKIVFLIVAFILKGVLYLLAFILNFISEVLVALQYILARRCIDRLFMAHIHGFQHDVLFKQCGG